MAPTCANPEFLNENTAENGAVLVWQDLTKLGKLSSKDLNSLADTMANILKVRPGMSIGFIAAPILISEKVSNNARDEMRRVEDKLDAKGLSNFLVTLWMEIPPSSKKVPLIFHGWLVIDEASGAENAFQSSNLYLDRRGDGAGAIGLKLACSDVNWLTH